MDQNQYWLIDIARLTGSLPVRRALVGIQPQIMDWGEEPTPAVRAAIPAAARHVLELLERWHHSASDLNGVLP